MRLISTVSVAVTSLCTAGNKRIGSESARRETDRPVTDPGRSCEKLTDFNHWPVNRCISTSCFIVLQSVSSFCFFIRHLYLSVALLGCSLKALSSTSRVDTPLTADWLQVCFGTRPRLSFIKRFWKIKTLPLTSPCLASICSERCLELCITSTSCVRLPL